MPTEPAREVAPGVFLVDTGYVRPDLAACYLVRGGDRPPSSRPATPRDRAAPAGGAGAARHRPRGGEPRHRHPRPPRPRRRRRGADAARCRRPRWWSTRAARATSIDPSKLWAGTVGVYGEAATRALYGEPSRSRRRGSSRRRTASRSSWAAGRLRFLDAPGHARHHFVVLDEATRGFFTGDTFGLSYREADGGASGPFFFPTTTPVQFDPAALHATLDRMLAEQPERRLPDPLRDGGGGRRRRTPRRCTAASTSTSRRPAPPRPVRGATRRSRPA